MEQIKLVRPGEEYLDQVWDFRREFLEAGSSTDGCGPLRGCETAREWLERVTALSSPETLPQGRVLSTQFLTVREGDNKLVGMIQVRHYFNDYLEKFGGHIGYSVRPSERRKGYAAGQLRQTLAWCKEELGLERVLITCLVGNEGSRRTILSAGGVYDGTVHEPNEDIDLERYWIAL